MSEPPSPSPTFEEQCVAIVRALMESVCVEGKTVTLEPDFSGYTLTVVEVWEDGGKQVGDHTHTGYPDCSLEDGVESLYDTLTGGPGLSWHREVKPDA